LTPTQLKLLAAFDSEQHEILSRLRFHMMACEQDGKPLESAALDESLRMVHTLKGAARVIDFGSVVELAHQMETLFSQARLKKVSIHRNTARVILGALDTIEDLVYQFIKQNKVTPELEERSSQALVSITALIQDKPSSEELLQIQSHIETQSAKAPRDRSDVEMIRVKAESLDNLLATASELSGLLQQQKDPAYRRLSEQLKTEIQRVRRVPLETILDGLPSMVRELAQKQGKRAEVRLYGQEIEADKMVLQALRSPLIHMLRNCISHGLETVQERKNAGKEAEGRVALHFKVVGDMLRIEVEDDGRGLNWEAVNRLGRDRGIIREGDSPTRRELAQVIFQPGFSTSTEVTEVSGRGMGLSVVRETLIKLRGNVEVDITERTGTKFVLSVPMKIALDRLILCECQNQTYAIPFSGIDRVLRIQESELRAVEGRLSVFINDVPLPIVSLSSLLNLGPGVLKPDNGKVPIVILNSGLASLGKKAAIAVDRFLGEGEFLVKNLGAIHDENLSLLGAVLLENGIAAPVLNPTHLLGGLGNYQSISTLETPAETITAREIEVGIRRILVVDDSITTRTLEKGILEANGYEVELAVNGEEGLKKLYSQQFDLVISDIEMPVMDGFTFLSEIKKNPRFIDMPVIVVTSKDSLQEQQRGRQLGADHYIVKQKFDQTVLLNAILNIK